MGKPRILLFDIETSHFNAAVFSLYPEAISHNNIIDEWFIISVAYKDLHSKTTRAISVLDFKRKSLTDDYGLCKRFREVLEDVDIIVGHNSDKFDIKKFNARLIYHKLPPLPKITQIDTLKEVKKIAQFPSHRLDYLGMHLFGQGKQETSAGLWLRARTGDKKAIKEMVGYNKIDVVRLEQLYLRLRPYFKSHPHVGVYSGPKESCKHCGSEEFLSEKIRYTATGLLRYQRQCAECYAYGTYNK